MSTRERTPTENVADYPWAECEPRWQDAWQKAEVFAAPQLPEGTHGLHIFAAAPFTSGSAHMGHVRSYTIADAYARFKRATGAPVLFTMGFDAFGLPAELAASKAEVKPRDWVERCARMMRGQFDAMGYSFDWGRTFITSDEDMYRWSQWLFISLLERDLIYEKEAPVDWCESCETVLARSQTEDGRCWRCGDPVTLVSRSQWFLRATRYLAECSAGLPGLSGWDDSSLGSQRGVLGETAGFEVDAATIDGRTLTVFTQDAARIGDGRFVALAPGHPEVDAWIPTEDVRSAFEQLRRGGWMRGERGANEAEFVDTTVQVVVPGSTRMLPVVIAPYVEPRFGPTAVLGIGEQDATADVIAGKLEALGVSGLQMTPRPVKARPAVRFSAADFPVSRQRSWGAPIPLVHCEVCGVVPVPQDELPVRLPDDLRAGAQLSDHQSFYECLCPRCGGAARRDTQTLDCHVDALWIWIPACVPPAARADEMFTHEQVARWLPVHQIVWGQDGGAYILSQRTAAKMLRDIGVLDDHAGDEPFERALMHGMVQQGGRKMSKHLGNVVDPDELIKSVGADTVRLAILYAAAPKNSTNWSDQDVTFCHRFLKRMWSYASAESRCQARFADTIDLSDAGRRRLARWCATATRKMTRDLDELQMHRAARNAMLLLDRIEDFERRACADGGELGELDRVAVGVALRLLVQLIAPLTPHIAEALWELMGCDSFVSTAPWPGLRGEEGASGARNGAIADAGSPARAGAA